MKITRPRTRWAAALALVLALPLAAVLLSPTRSPASADPAAHGTSLTAAQRAALLGIARDTWKFYAADVDPGTHLPLDNLTYAGGSATPTTYGRYTSAANIGVYLWAVA